MVYKTYSDRIILVNDDNKVLAEIDFPAINAYAVNVSHIWVDESLRGQGVASKLTDKMVAYLRHRNLKALPSCSYAMGWFEKHPEASDVLWSQGLRHSNLGGTGDGGLREKQIIYQTKIKKQGSGIQIPAILLKTLNRLFQLACAGFMAAAAVLFLMSAWQNRQTLGAVSGVLSERNYPMAVFLILCAVFILFCSAECLWIMSRKKYAQSDKLVAIDTGRGITAFLLLLVLYFLCENEMSMPFQPLDRIWSGVQLAAESFHMCGPQMMRMAVLGLILSVGRKLLGR